MTLFDQYHFSITSLFRELGIDKDHYARNLSQCNIVEMDRLCPLSELDEDDKTFPIVGNNNAPEPVGRSTTLFVIRERARY